MSKTPRTPFVIPNVQSAAGNLTAARRWHPENDTTELEQTLATARIATFAREVMADAPALTKTHIDAVAAILAKAGA